ncbi:C39 family peptidase [Burkholderia alba]|uniref:C39 family peptidase n=1 Tax=Burkholderia alba TaxID=2683677 RepID=UPI002B05424A|nr:papain-like cysteine protease family protein [Burkholderia alba]
MKALSLVRRSVALLGLALPIAAMSGAQQLNVPIVQQDHSEWCWAADADAVLTYRNISTSQCAIANWVSGVGYACNNSSFDWNDAVNSPNYLSGTTGISGILWSLGRRNSTYYDEPLSYQAVTSAIRQGNPVVILWQWPNGGGHFLVVDGYDDNGQMMYFMNPWPGEGAGYGDYDWMSAGTGNMGTHTWVESLVTH